MTASGLLKDLADRPERNFALHYAARQGEQSLAAIHTDQAKLYHSLIDERNSSLQKRDLIWFHAPGKSGVRLHSPTLHIRLPSCRQRKPRKTSLRSGLCTRHLDLSESSPSPRDAKTHSRLRDETAP